ncbi:MAG: hypothetical protein KF798_01305 [Candidatus Paracaedibacteraceae bacterium]|nr:hypothetical protein [Candidatus Paracaedibacteraceae bacterium]
MKNLSILMLLFGLTLSVQAAGDTSQCPTLCSKCDDMTMQQNCMQNCGHQAADKCRVVKPNIKSVSDANNFGAEQFQMYKTGLLEIVPTVQSVIENTRNTFKYADQAGTVDANLVRDTQEFLSRLGAHAAELVMNMEYTAKQKGSNVEAVMQIKSLFDDAMRSTSALSKQRFQNLGDLRKSANEILLKFKNVFGQGTALKYMIDTTSVKPDRVAQVKGVSKAMLCNLQCRASSCGKSPALTVKCMKNCEPKKISSCVTAAKKTGVYETAKELLNITPVASGVLSTPKKELYQGAGDSQLQMMMARPLPVPPVQKGPQPQVVPQPETIQHPSSVQQAQIIPTPAERVAQSRAMAEQARTMPSQPKAFVSPAEHMSDLARKGIAVSIYPTPQNLDRGQMPSAGSDDIGAGEEDSPFVSVEEAQGIPAY